MSAGAPYDQLYIYEITGDARAAAPGADTGAGFLGLWLEEDSSFLFFDRPAEEAVAAVLVRDVSLSLRERHQMSYAQWQGGSGLEELRLAGLTVLPAGAPEPPDDPGPVLRLDPGLVFGNGLHPTTRHCLELLMARAELGPLGRVMDLGTGTGILALAAALMGADSVLAVDLNPLCVATCQNNARLNRLAVEAAEGEAARFLGQPAELVMANLHWQALEGLLGREGALAGKTDLILSGFTRSYVAALTHRLGELGFQVRARRSADSTWFSLWARRLDGAGAQG